MQTILTLVRHGETGWNRDGRWQGHADVPLSDLGREQARRLAERLLTEKATFDQLYCSDLSRALETAEIIGLALGLRPSPLLELREIDLGAWSGLHRDEIAAQFPTEWAAIQAGRDVRRGGGESFADLRKRVSAVLADLVREHPGQRLCIVTHGGVIHAALAHLQRPDWEESHRLRRIQNASLTKLLSDSGGWRIERVNDIDHLEGPELATDMAVQSGEANSL